MLPPTTNGLHHRRLRVAHVAPGLDIGGLEKLLVEFARHTDREKFALYFISLSGRGTLAADIEACGWSVLALDEPPGLRPGLVFRLSCLLQGWNIDVLHTHNNTPLIYGAPAARLAGVRAVIQTRHGRSSRASRRQTTLFRSVTRLADRVVCVSDDNARLSAREGIPPRKLRRVWSGIDVSCFSYIGSQAGGPAVLVARLSPEKDVATLLQAVTLVIREQPSFRLEIAGDGACLSDLKRLAAELGLNEHVHFLGQVRDIPALLARASVFVMSSLTEGISLTLLEAMARGLPIVATDVGGNPEAVVDGLNGYLVPTKNPTALAAKILFLLRNPEIGRQMGQAGRRRVEECFNSRVMVKQYEDLYRQLVIGSHAFGGPCEQPVSGHHEFA